MKVDNRIIAGVSVLAVAAVFLWGRSCGVKSVIIKEGKPEIKWLKPDTFRIKGEPVPVLVEVIKWKKSAPQLNPSVTLGPPIEFFDVSPANDTPAIVESFNSVYVYEYNERFQHPTDSTIKGGVHIGDTISQNTFFGRGVNITFDSIPKITKSKIIIQPKKPVLYFKASAIFNDRFLPKGGGPEVMYKAPNEKTYEIGAKYIIGNGLYFEYTQGFPIRLKKK